MANKKGTQKSVEKQATSTVVNEEQEMKKTNTTPLEVRIDRLINKPDSNVKAIASINIDGNFAVHGVKITKSEKGLFVSMPSTSYNKNGNMQYSDTFHPITAEAREDLISKVKEAYEQALANLQDVKQEETEEEAEEESEAEVPEMGPVM